MSTESRFDVERTASAERREHGVADAVRLAHRIASVRTPTLRRAAVGLFVEDLGCGASAMALELVLRQVLRGDSMARDAWLAVAQWLVSRSREPEDVLTDALRTAAASADLDGLSAVLLVGAERRSLSDAVRRRATSAAEAESFMFPMFASGVEMALLTNTTNKIRGRCFLVDEPSDGRTCFSMIDLGHREMRSYLRAFHVIDKLTSSWIGPIVVRRLFARSRLEHDDVLVLLTRRPVNPYVSYEAALSGRWGSSARVREALVSNPFTPSAIVLPLLPIVSRKTLEGLAAIEDEPSVVVEAARRIVVLERS